MTREREIALEARESEEARLKSPSAARNREPIRAAFLATRPARGDVIEIASGTGEHVIELAAAAVDLFWRPGDPDARSRQSIAAWTAHCGLKNIAPPHAADMTKRDWTDNFAPAAAILSINMIHIAPFAAAEGLFAGARRLLSAGGRIFLYGPFARGGAHTAPSNEAFDASLKARDPRWGVRDLDLEVAPLAARHGFSTMQIVEMPANNLFVVFEKSA